MLPSLLMNAAISMVNLEEAYLVASPLSAYIIRNIPEYTNLRKLVVGQVDAQSFIWGPHLTKLTSLRWELKNFYLHQGMVSSQAAYLLRVVEDTCPALRTLDIVACPSNSAQWTTSTLRPPEGSRRHSGVVRQSSESPNLRRLSHFGQYYDPHYHEGFSLSFESGCLDFMKRYCNQLKSVVIPVKVKHHYIDFDNVLDYGSLLPNLRELSLAMNRQDVVSSPFGADSLERVLVAIATAHPLLEKLSISCIGRAFSRQVGEFFEPFLHLKYLRVGDMDHSADNDPYKVEETLDCKGYAQVFSTPHKCKFELELNLDRKLKRSLLVFPKPWKNCTSEFTEKRLPL